MTKVKNLHYYDHRWLWRTESDFSGPSKGVYFTTQQGEGIFFQDDRTGDIRMIAGPCQFSACKTASGMRRKLMRRYNQGREWD